MRSARGREWDRAWLSGLASLRDAHGFGTVVRWYRRFRLRQGYGGQVAPQPPANGFEPFGFGDVRHQPHGMRMGLRRWSGGIVAPAPRPPANGFEPSGFGDVRHRPDGMHMGLGRWSRAPQPPANRSEPSGFGDVRPHPYGFGDSRPASGWRIIARGLCESLGFAKGRVSARPIATASSYSRPSGLIPEGCQLLAGGRACPP